MTEQEREEEFGMLPAACHCCQEREEEGQDTEKDEEQ